MSKIKGSRAERELFHFLWNSGWAVLRVAGSGSTSMPAPDLLAGNRSRFLAIECKSLKKKTQYLERQQMDELRIFAEHFGAEPWVGVRFDKIGWYFFPLPKIPDTGNKSLSITLDFAKSSGLSLEKFSSMSSEQLNNALSDK